MLRLIYDFHRMGLDALAAGAAYNRLTNLPVREKIGRSKYIAESEIGQFDEIAAQLKQEIRGLDGGEAGVEGI